MFCQVKTSFLSTSRGSWCQQPNLSRTRGGGLDPHQTAARVSSFPVWKHYFGRFRRFLWRRSHHTGFTWCLNIQLIIKGKSVIVSSRRTVLSQSSEREKIRRSIHRAERQTTNLLTDTECWRLQTWRRSSSIWAQTHLRDRTGPAAWLHPHSTCMRALKDWEEKTRSSVVKWSRDNMSQQGFTNTCGVRTCWSACWH